MKHNKLCCVVAAAAGLVLAGYWGSSAAQMPLAVGADADITDDGLHRIDPLIMEAAWVKPDLDLTKYARILLMPTAVQFRNIPERTFNARTRVEAQFFPIEESRKEWLRRQWREAVNARFQQERSYPLYNGIADNVLVVQGFLIDVVTRIPPEDIGSNYGVVRDPWQVSVVLELRDATTTELLARTMDRRLAEGILDPNSAWIQTRNLMERWAQVLNERLDQLADLSGPGARTPEWAR